MWGRWLSGLYGAPRWPRWLGFVPGIVWMTLIALGVRAFVHAFDIANAVDPAEKARVLAESIRNAMNLFAFAWAFLVLFVIPMLALTWRYRWSQKTAKAEGQPPYR
jgi:hypothetical protein